MTPVVVPSAERPHAPGPGAHWTESWYVDFSDPHGRGGFLRLALVPEQRVAWVWGAYADSGATVLVRDHEVPLPKGGGLEVRASGLWVDLTCETPLVHWSLGLEAFGVALEHPLDAWEGERGVRVPLGFDLEWEAVEPPFEYPQPAGRAESGHFQHAGRVHGEVLVGDDRVAFDGWGQRDRFWGERDWWSVGWHWAAFRLGGSTTVSVARPDRPGSEHARGYVAVEGEDPHPIIRAEVESRWSSHRLPEGTAYALETGLEVEARVEAVVPILIPGGAAAPGARLSRALCTFTSPAGSGTGWAEWLQPPPASVSASR